MLDDGPIIVEIILKSNNRIGLVTSESGNRKASQSGTRGGLVTRSVIAAKHDGLLRQFFFWLIRQFNGHGIYTAKFPTLPTKPAVS